MNRDAAEELVSELYKYVLLRQPGTKEFNHWVSVLCEGSPPAKILRAFYESVEYKNKQPGVFSIFPPGHFHSPVVDPAAVRGYVERERNAGLGELAGIKVDLGFMRDLWCQNLSFIKKTPFTDERVPENRYHYVGGPFPHGDAITLRMMVGHHRPKRVIEIGSGFSSACILDSAEHAGIPDLHLTCIEPDPTRLRRLLRADDFKRIDLIERLVQDVPSSIVDELNENDFLFIDSTHVLKTGSDVHYEFFRLMPRLKPGVVVHFHDIHFPFEYSDEWIFKSNYSWNEAYALRAFLMFNNEFRITFWTPLYARSFRSEINDEFPAFLRNTGGSIWLQRVGNNVVR